MSNKFPNINAERSLFDLSHEVYTTRSFGEVQVNLFETLLPKDELNLRTKAFIKSGPLATPIMSAIYANIRSFVCPIKTVFKYFPEFIAKNKSYYFDLAQRKPSALNAMDKEGQQLNNLPSFNLHDFASHYYICCTQCSYTTANLNKSALRRIRMMQINTMISGNTLPDGSRVPFMLADMCFDNSIKRIYHKVDTAGNKDHWYIEFVPGQRLLIKYADGGYAAQGIYSYVHMWYDGSTGQNSFTINTQDVALSDAQFINDNYYQDHYPENDQYRQLFSLIMSSESYFGVNSIADNLGIHLCPQVQNNSVVYGDTDEKTGPVWQQVCDLDNSIDVCVLPFVAINRAYIEQYMPLPTQISPLQWLESYYSVIEWYGTLPSALGNVATVLHDNLTPNYSSIACDQFYPIFHKRIPLLMNDYFTTAWELPDHGASLEEAPIKTTISRASSYFYGNTAYAPAYQPTENTATVTFEEGNRVIAKGSGDASNVTATWTQSVSMMSLKWAESAMRFRRRGGMDVTYNMYINNHWGVSTNGDGKDNNAVIVLGGSRDALNVSPVIQTEENEFAPAANESGRASTVADSRPYHYFSDDYAYLFQLMHLSTPNIYGEGVERQFTYIKKEEYRDLLPEFQELGDTPIKMSELTAFTTRDKVYGYHNRLQFLKGKYDKVCGNMRNVMSAFLCTPNHTFNPIITEPSLSITHLQATKDRYNNIFADMSGTYSDFILDIHHDLKILRPLSKLNAVGI